MEKGALSESGSMIRAGSRAAGATLANLSRSRLRFPSIIIKRYVE